MNSINKDYKHRDEVIWGNFDTKRYELGGCCRFNMDANKFKLLYREGFIDPEECQNESPTSKYFLESIEDCEDCVEFEAYAISPYRDDYRITIEGIVVCMPENRLDDFLRFVEEFRYADEFTVEKREDKYYLRAWWD